MRLHRRRRPIPPRAGGGPCRPNRRGLVRPTRLGPPGGVVVGSRTTTSWSITTLQLTVPSRRAWVAVPDIRGWVGVAASDPPQTISVCPGRRRCLALLRWAMADYHRVGECPEGRGEVALGTQSPDQLTALVRSIQPDGETYLALFFSSISDVEHLVALVVNRTTSLDLKGRQVRSYRTRRGRRNGRR